MSSANPPVRNDETAVILAAVALALSPFPFLGIMGIASLVVAIRARRLPNSRATRRGALGMSIAAIVIGLLSTGAVAFVFLLVYASLAYI